MSPFKFPCPNCGQRLAVFEDQIGTSEPCPACGAMVTVPDPRLSPPPVPVPKDTEAKTPAEARAEPKAAEPKPQEAAPKAAPPAVAAVAAVAASDAVKGPVTVDARHLATDTTPAPKKDREPSPKPPLDSKKPPLDSKPDDRPAIPDRTTAAAKAPVTVDARHLATDTAPAPKADREPSHKPPLDAKKPPLDSKPGDRPPVPDRSTVSDRAAVPHHSAISGPHPSTTPADALHRVAQRFIDSRFLTLSVVLHAIVVLMVGGMVLYPAIVERPDFEAGADGKLVQTDDQQQPPDLPAYSREKSAEFAPQLPPLVAPLNAVVSATQLKPAWTVKVAPPSSVRGLSDSMKGALAAMNNRVAAQSSTMNSRSAGAAFGRSGGLRSASIFGQKITASRLGVILDVSGSARPHLTTAIEEIQRGFGDALLILYPGCGMVKVEGPPEHTMRLLADIPPEELPNNAAYFSTASDIVSVMKIPEFEQMARRPSVKNTLLVSWYAPAEGTPDKLTNQAQLAFEDLMKRGVDAIYWFADFEDPIDPRVADPLIAQLTFKRIKVHLHNFAENKINSEATNIATKTGGTTNADKPAK